MHACIRLELGRFILLVGLPNLDPCSRAHELTCLVLLTACFRCERPLTIGYRVATTEASITHNRKTSGLTRSHPKTRGGHTTTRNARPSLLMPSHREPLTLLLILLSQRFDSLPYLFRHEVELLILRRPHLIPEMTTKTWHFRVDHFK